MIVLYVVTFGLVLASLIANREKTAKALKTAARMFMNLLPSFVSILVLVSVVLTAMGPETIKALLGSESGPLGWLIAALSGSVALIPGFVAYPLAGVLVKNGVGLPIIAVFVTTLMMVGIITLPLEKKFFGWRVALARNGLNFLAALAIGALIALIWSLR